MERPPEPTKTDAPLPEPPPRKEHHGREYIVAAIGALAEYLAVRFEIDWLAWLATVLIFLAIVEYTRPLFRRPNWKYATWILTAVAMIIGTYFLTHKRTVDAPRATIFIDQVLVGWDHGVVKVTIVGKVGGEDILNGTMQGALVGADCRTAFTDDLNDLFRKGDFQSAGWVSGLNNVTHVGETIGFSEEYTGHDVDESQGVYSGSLCLYVLTKAYLRDKWGSVPEQTSCSTLNAKSNFLHRQKCMSGNN
jgi:hypothetical protein